MSENEIDPASLKELIGEYWCLAYAEGKEGRAQDTDAGDAQRVWNEIESAIDRLTAGVEHMRIIKSQDGDHVSFCHAEMDRLTAERDAAVADAERYRWLRDNCQEVADYYATAGQLYFGTYGYGGIDVAIDVERKEGK